MLLYINGDSFTAGNELADDQLPGWPGYSDMLDSESQQYKKNIAWIHKIHKDPSLAPLRNRIAVQERKLAWPNTLAALLKCPVINSAEGGSSFDRIARTTISDLINLKKQHENIVVVLSVTDIFRCETPHYDNPLFWEPFDLKTIPDVGSEDYHAYKMLVKFKLKYEKLFHRLWNFYYQALQIKNFCRLNNIKLFWVEVFPEGMYPDAEEQQHDYIRPLKEEVDISFIASMTVTAQEDYQDNRKYCPGGHYRKEIHDIFAKKLYQQIKDII